MIEKLTPDRNGMLTNEETLAKINEIIDQLNKPCKHEFQQVPGTGKGEPIILKCIHCYSTWSQKND